MRKLMREFINAVWEVFKLPFVLIAIGFRRLYTLGWRKLLMLFVAAVVLTFVVMFSFLEATSQPQFCSSCHLMEPYIEAWKTSSHADVHCLKCHAREGVSGYIETKFTALSMLVNYATGLYKRSKPWAEIEDAACLQCHETRLLDGKIETAMGVHFDHTPHLTQERRGRKLRCTSCHSQIVQGEHISITPTTCFLCHFKNLDEEERAELSACTKCHTPPVGEHAAERNVYDHSSVLADNIDCTACHQPMWQGQGEVRKERCGACHSEANHIDRIDDLEFIHEWHIEKRKVDCQQCHDPIEHKQPELATIVTGECASCHTDPHAPMLAVYSGTESRLVPGEYPDVMYKSGVACFSCHKNPLTGMGQARIGEDACTPCHSANYLKLADNWRAGFTIRIEKLEAAFRAAGDHPQIEDARHDVALVRRGGAWHNPTWADRVLDAAEKVLTEAGVAQASSNTPKASAECLVCHGGIEAVELSVDFSAFDHSRHLADRGIVCTTCHVKTSPEDAAHGQMKKPGDSCANCHHSEAVANGEESCTPCHQPSRLLYTGRLPGVEEDPSPMASMEMACTDCHMNSEGYRAPGDDFCLDCHGQEVVDHLQFLRGSLRNKVSKLGASVSKAEEILRLDNGRAVHHPDLVEKIASQ